jgi:hypothetical protein
MGFPAFTCAQEARGRTSAATRAAICFRPRPEFGHPFARVGIDYKDTLEKLVAIKFDRFVRQSSDAEQ